MFSGYCVPKIIEIGLLLTELYKNYGKVAFFETQCVLNDTTQSVAQVISCKLQSLNNTAISSNKIQFHHPPLQVTVILSKILLWQSYSPRPTEIETVPVSDKWSSSVPTWNKILSLSAQKGCSFYNQFSKQQHACTCVLAQHCRQTVNINHVSVLSNHLHYHLWEHWTEFFHKSCKQILLTWLQYS